MTKAEVKEGSLWKDKAPRAERVVNSLPTQSARCVQVVRIDPATRLRRKGSATQSIEATQFTKRYVLFEG